MASYAQACTTAATTTTTSNAKSRAAAATLSTLIGIVLVLFPLTGCSSNSDVTDEIGTQVVTLPNGKKIRVESARSEVELMRGLMFRESMPSDRGMLFTHPSESAYRYWMYQCKMPLDIIWMDTSHRVVEISANTPPCTSTSASACPNYGGNAKSRFVLELNAGAAAANAIRVGETLQF